MTCQDDIPPDGGVSSNVSTRLFSTRSTRWVSSNVLPRTATNGPVTCNDVPLPSGNASAGMGSTFQQQEHIHDDIEEDQHKYGAGFASFDDPLPWSNKDADTSFDKEGEPNKCVMKLYEALLEAQANPLGLDRFSSEEKVHIELLHLLNVLNAPMIGTA